MATSRASRQHRSSLSNAHVARRKRVAAVAAAELLEDGMLVGLGTGSTVAHLLPAIAARNLGKLRCVATSPTTEQVARTLGLTLVPFDELGQLDIAIDGADQVDPEGWLVKGGGGAHTREKIIAAAAARFAVIASAEKAVAEIGPPVPLELVSFGVQHTLEALAPARLRDAPPSPDGGLIADYLGPVRDPRALAAWLSASPGVVEHGLFAPEMVSLILLGGDSGVEQRGAGKRWP